MYDKIVIVTRKTRYEELIERFNTAGQAKFYIEHAGGDFNEYLTEHSTYLRAIDTLRRQADIGFKQQSVDRSLVPTFTFTQKDIVIAAGQDGLIANTAKYVGAQPLIGVNPDPARNDGVLLPFAPEKTRAALAGVIEGRARIRPTTLAEVALNDGQRLLAFNDFFVGARTHVSARYQITMGKKSEAHSSSGVLVSTGAGSTGWLSSIFNMAAGVSAFSGGTAGARMSLKPDDPRLVFVVREPFISRHSLAGIIAGMIEAGAELQVESLMPSGGTIFSDGIENDFLEFNSGAVAHIRRAARTAQLVVG